MSKNPWEASRDSSSVRIKKFTPLKMRNGYPKADGPCVKGDFGFKYGHVWFLWEVSGVCIFDLFIFMNPNKPSQNPLSTSGNRQGPIYMIYIYNMYIYIY